MAETEKKTGSLRYDGTMTITSVLRSHEDAVYVLASYGLKGCSSCKITDTETLEEAARTYRIPLEPLLDSLNNLQD